MHTTTEKLKKEYTKRSGTANIRGQLYETKLLTMIFLRALRCHDITEFLMGTNLDEVGDMDDVCLRFKTRNDDYAIYLQAKHKHDVTKGVVKSADIWQATSDFSLHKCFGSYKKTRESFSVDSSNDFFRGKYENIKSYYVMYTTIKADIKDLRKKKPSGDEIVYSLIGTGKRNHIFQFASDDENVKLLTTSLLKERINTLAKSFMQFKRDDKYEMMLLDEDIRNFHVILAQKVLNVSEINDEGYRIGTFRSEFFNSNEEILIVLREALYAEVDLKNNRSTDDMERLINLILDEPTANSFSEVLGDILVYDKGSKCLKLINGGLEFHSKYQTRLKSLKVPESILNDALGIANSRKLQSYNIKLPKGFGNLDMTINEKKRASRIKYLAGKLSDLIKSSADEQGNVFIRRGIFSPVKTQDDGVLDINGGIAGAMGNLLLPDGENKYKFNTNSETLGINAKELLEKLLEDHQDLHKYRLCIDIDSFPRLSWHDSEKEKQNAKDFFDKFYFYTMQEKEDKFESILTNELKEIECSNYFNKLESLIKANALYLKIHSEIQSWWMIEGTTYYLERDMDNFNKIFRNIKNKGLLSLLNYIYLHDVKNFALEFDTNAVDVLSVCKSDTQNAKLIVIHTDVHVLTCYKLIQYLDGAEDYTFINIDYIGRVSQHLMEMVISDLSVNDISNVVLVCEDITKYNINELIGSCRAKKIILVTSNYIRPEACVYVRDDKINLTDLTASSQLNILQAQFIYQGVDVTFADVFDNSAKHLIDPKILNKIINKQQISLGQTLEPSTYEETKHCYVPRTLTYNEVLTDSSETLHNYTSMTLTSFDEYPKSTNTFSPSTLFDHRHIFRNRFPTTPHDVVLLLDVSGMGKSTLLTYLSVETKKQYPKIWIQRVNLIDHTKQFYEWQRENIEVDDQLALKFICTIITSKRTFRGNVLTFDNNIDFEIVNDDIRIINNINDESLVLFELRTFLHFYREGSVIFLFDGFDEICPMYKQEVIDLVKCLSVNRNKNYAREDVDEYKLPNLCTWITSRSYNDLKDKLEYEFGKSYTLQPFTYTDVNLFLDKYMIHNLRLNTLSSEQIKNINVFFDYMKRFSSNSSHMENGLNLTNLSLHSIYVAALRYFNSETKRIHLSEDLMAYAKEWAIQVSEDFVQNYRGLNDAFTLSGVPLHVYLAVNYFYGKIKNTKLTNTENAKTLWDLDTNAFAFYEGFLETKLKTIFFEEKHCMDVTKPGVLMIYEKVEKEFRDNHKKLAFYAVFQERELNEMELEEVNRIMSEMENGREKTGLVDRIVNGVPKFVHYTFAEYFAVEYILDFLKSGVWNKQKRIIYTIMYRILSGSMSGVLSILDLKLKQDPEVLKSITCTKVHSYVFECLVDQYNSINSSEYLDDSGDIFGDYTTLHLEKVLNMNLTNLIDYLLHAVMDVANKKNLVDFLNLMDNGLYIDKLFNRGYYDIGLDIIECIRSIDETKLDRL